MAKFYIDEYVLVNSYKNIKSVSWEISIDEDFTLIIDSTYKNSKDKNGWFSKLPRLDDKGYYDNTTVLYTRCKIHTSYRGEEEESDWFMKPINDTEVIRRKIISNSKVVGEYLLYPDGTTKRIW